MNEWLPYPENEPNDDENVLVINSKVQMLPLKAFYCASWKEFMSLENVCNVPISITHWMKMPKMPLAKKQP